MTQTQVVKAHLPLWFTRVNLVRSCIPLKYASASLIHFHAIASNKLIPPTLIYLYNWDYFFKTSLSLSTTRQLQKLRGDVKEEDKEDNISTKVTQICLSIVLINVINTAYFVFHHFPSILFRKWFWATFLQVSSEP